MNFLTTISTLMLLLLVGVIPNHHTITVSPVHQPKTTTNQPQNVQQQSAATTTAANVSNNSTVVVEQQQPSTVLSSSAVTRLNQTERFRRLIPYMTFYVPTNDYLPINEAYNYNSNIQTNDNKHQHQKQVNIAAVNHYLHASQQQNNQNSQQLHGGGGGGSEERVQPPPPLPPSVQSQQLPQQTPHLHIPSSPQYSSQSHRIQNSQQKQQQSPLLEQLNNPPNGYNSYISSNKFPNNRQQQHQQQQHHQQQQQPIIYGSHNNQPNKPYRGFQSSATIQQMPPYQQLPRLNYNQIKVQQSIRKEKITPFLPTNQIPGEFQPIIYNDDDDDEAQNYEILNQNGHNAQNNYPPQIVEIKSVVPPKSIKQFIKITSPKPDSHHQNYQKITPRPQTTSSPQSIEQYDGPVKQIYYQNDENILRDSKINDHQPQPQSHHYQPTQQKIPPANSKQIYSNIYDYSYTLDPNDGYGGKIPTKPPPIIIRHHQTPRPRLVSKGKYGGYSMITSTVTPIIASPTPFYKYNNGEPIKSHQQQYHQEKLSESLEELLANEHPATMTTSKTIRIGTTKLSSLPVVHQHLTETTQIQAPPPKSTYLPHQYPIPKEPSREYIQAFRQKQYSSTPPPPHIATPTETYIPSSPSPAPPPPSPPPPQPPSTPTEQYLTPIIHTTPKPQYIPVPQQVNISPNEQYYPIVPPHLISPGHQSQLPPSTSGDNHDVSHATQLGAASLSEVLHKLQKTKLLSTTLSAENIDASIKTLVDILKNLKESQFVAEIPSQHVTTEGGSYNYQQPEHEQEQHGQHQHQHQQHQQHQSQHQQQSGVDYEDETDYENRHQHIPHPDNSAEELAGPNTGRPGIDYPNLSEIPKTAFNCKEQRYKGFFGDPETHCQVWHYCDLNGGQASFLCPNGTIFSQAALTCDWWFNVKCSSTIQLYVLNERLYKYILPFSPKFPEDYSGPVVDKYLAVKFQEMEEQMKRQKEKGKLEAAEKAAAAAAEHAETEQDIPDENGGNNDEEDVDNDTHPKTSEDSKLNIEKTTIDSSEPQIDDEGQSHNVDMATQYPASNEIIYHPSGSSPTTEHIQPPSTSPLIPPLPTSEINYLLLSSTTQSPSTGHSTSTVDNNNYNDDDSEDEEIAHRHQQLQHLQQLQQQQHYKGQPSGRQLSVVQVESEKVDVIEIKSDGSTGHLVPHEYKH